MNKRFVSRCVKQLQTFVKEMAMRVGILEDDTHIGQLLSLWLEEAGHDCDLYLTGETFQRGLMRESYDLLLLDWMLPDTSGDKVIVWVREHVGRAVPVIFVTSRDTEEDIVRGLDLGADDYLTKPVRRSEFLARVNAVMRRAQGGTDLPAAFEMAPFVFDLQSREVRRGRESIPLTQKEFELALFLFRNAGRLLSRGHLLESIWGKSSDITTRTVDTHVSRLRGKLGIAPENGWRLSAVYNHGYRLEPVVVTQH
jgi:DNA-binding response OmpR family regulator